MTPSDRRTPPHALMGVVVLLATILAACGSAAAPTVGPTSPSGPTVTPTPVPGAPGNGGVDGGSGSGGGSGGGVVIPPGGGGLDPILGQPTWVTPAPGQLDPRPVNVQLLRASADGRQVSAELRWWSGVAPCSVLDSVTVATDPDAHSVTLTAVEGSSARDVACIDIAQLKATTVDLGELAAGSWTIIATGDAPRVTLEID